MRLEPTIPAMRRSQMRKAMGKAGVVCSSCNFGGAEASNMVEVGVVRDL